MNNKSRPSPSSAHPYPDVGVGCVCAVWLSCMCAPLEVTARVLAIPNTSIGRSNVDGRNDKLTQDEHLPCKASSQKIRNFEPEGQQHIRMAVRSKQKNWKFFVFRPYTLVSHFRAGSVLYLQKQPLSKTGRGCCYLHFWLAPPDSNHACNIEVAVQQRRQDEDRPQPRENVVGVRPMCQHTALILCNAVLLAFLEGGGVQRAHTHSDPAVYNSGNLKYLCSIGGVRDV